MTNHKTQTRLVTGGLSGTTDTANDEQIINHFTRRVLPTLTLKPHTPSRSIKNPFGRVGHGYNNRKCVETRLQRGNRNRHSCGFFTSIGFTQWAGGFTGNCKAHGVVRVSNTRPPSTLRNVGRGISQSHNGVNTMNKSTSCATAQPFKKINLSFEASAFGMARVTFENLDFTENDLQANRKRIIKAFKQACLSGRGILDKDLYKPLEAPIAYYAGNTIIKPWEVGFTLDAVQCTDAVIDSKADAIMQRIAVELNEYHAHAEGGAL